MTVLKQYKGSGTVTDPANWDTIFVGGPGPIGPQGPIGNTGSTGPVGPIGPPPTTVSLTRAAYNALAPPVATTVYIITDEGGVLLSGAGAPAAGLGFNGDHYFDNTAKSLYGPKTTGAWGSPTSLLGPPGPTGAGTGIIVAEGGAVIDTDIGTLDFGAGFDLTESPENEINVALDLSEYTGVMPPRTIATYGGAAVTAVITDAGKYVRFLGVNPVYTIPLNSSVAFTIGTQIDGISTGTPMTLAVTAGVTINRRNTLVTTGAKASWTLTKVGTDEWDLRGDLT